MIAAVKDKELSSIVSTQISVLNTILNSLLRKTYINEHNFDTSIIFSLLFMVKYCDSFLF